MKIEELKEYIHSDWSETAECRNDKYYFVSARAVCRGAAVFAGLAARRLSGYASLLLW